MTMDASRIDPALQARAELRQGPSGATLAISGVLNLDTAARTRKGAQAALRGATLSAVELDASGSEAGDMSGMPLITELAEAPLAPGPAASDRGRKPEFHLLPAALPAPAAIQSLEAPPARRSLLDELGARLIAV